MSEPTGATEPTEPTEATEPTDAAAPASGGPRDRRFPRAVYARGGEPDPRFSLANERTFLAWVRTSLALLAGGVALEAFEVPLHPTARAIAAGAALTLGLAAAVQAWLGWARTERALREGRPLPSPAVAPMLVVGLALATLGVVVGLLL